MLQHIIPATGLLFTLENILWINIGVFIGSVFAAIPGLSVILCVILFQEDQNVGVVYLAEAGQSVAVDLLDGDDAGIVSVDLAEGVLEGAGENLLVGDMEDAFVDLFGGLSVQGAQYVVGPVCVGGDKAVVPKLVVDILLIGLYPAAQVPHQGIGHGVLIDPAVGGDPSLAAGAAHQWDAPLAERGVDGTQYTGVVPGAEIDAHGISAAAVHRLHIPFQPLDVLHRHGGYLLQHVGSGGNTVQKRDDAHSVFHNAGLIAHPDAPDAGNAGEALLQSPHVVFELGAI